MPESTQKVGQLEKERDLLLIIRNLQEKVLALQQRLDLKTN